MWPSVEQELARILATRVFHTLADVPAYQEIYRRAGFSGKLPSNLDAAPEQVRQSLQSAAAMSA